MSSEGAQRFFNLVVEMRTHQKKYFQIRSIKELHDSKKYEEMVDEIISKTKEKMESIEQKKQQKLNLES